MERYAYVSLRHLRFAWVRLANARVHTTRLMYPECPILPHPVCDVRVAWAFPRRFFAGHVSSTRSPTTLSRAAPPTLESPVNPRGPVFRLCSNVCRDSELRARRISELRPNSKHPIIVLKRLELAFTPPRFFFLEAGCGSDCVPLTRICIPPRIRNADGDHRLPGRYLPLRLGRRAEGAHRRSFLQVSRHDPLLDISPCESRLSVVPTCQPRDL